MSHGLDGKSLSIRILIAMGIGATIGLILNIILSNTAMFENYQIVKGFNLELINQEGAQAPYFAESMMAFIFGTFHVIGQIFVNSLKMLVVPLVFISLVCGTCSLSDPKALGRVGGKALVLYLFTTGVAISLAILFAVMFAPGEGASFPPAEYTPKEGKSFINVLIDIVPTNPIAAMSDANMLQLIIFSILFGVSIALVGDAGNRIKDIFNELNNVVMKLVAIIMNLAPYGVFCLIAKLFGSLGFASILPLMSYFFLVIFVLILHATLTYPLLLSILTGLNPVTFLMKMRPTMLFAFSTASSNATIPVTLETTNKRLGVDNSIASFTVPLGATINMDGTAIMQGIATVFIANVYGVDLSVTQFLMVIMMAVMASIGAAGVPGVGLVLLAAVLDQVGLPVEGIGLIIGIDRLLDMTRTAVNVTGDAAVSTIVAHKEKKLNIDSYNNPHAGIEFETVDP